VVAVTLAVAVVETAWVPLAVVVESVSASASSLLVEPQPAAAQSPKSSPTI